MPGQAHNDNQEILRKYLIKLVPDFGSLVYEAYGKWTNNMHDNIQSKNINNSVPDLMILSKEKKLAYIGEAKQIKDYSEGYTKFKARSKIQLNNYFKWLKENEHIFCNKLIIYSVPSFCVSVTRNEVRKMKKKWNIKLCWDVIYL